LDRIWQEKILDYLDCEVGKLADPRTLGKALTGELRHLWRYRVGDYRIICDIRDDKLLILVVIIGHRKSVYR
jgi:mRNA interferase RelE/StbE